MIIIDCESLNLNNGELYREPDIKGTSVIDNLLYRYLQRLKAQNSDIKKTVIHIYISVIYCLPQADF